MLENIQLSAATAASQVTQVSMCVRLTSTHDVKLILQTGPYPTATWIRHEGLQCPR